MNENRRNFIHLTFVLILVSSVLSLAAHDDPPRFSVSDRLNNSANNIYSQDLDNIKVENLIDLGIGFPDFNPPEFLVSALTNAVSTGNWSMYQYTRYEGHPRLVKAIANFYSTILNRTLDPFSNVIITGGATQALFSTFQTYTFPGDEWIIIEPYYPPYVSAIKASQGIIKYITLKRSNITYNGSSNDLTFDREELANLFNEKTKGIVINTPHNPTGKVFTRDELEFIARLAQKWNTLVVADEVYEFLTYDNNEHVRIASLPGMFERTITIGSGGKLFSATGLRIGWAYGAAEIIKNLWSIHRYIALANTTPIQEAFAVMFEEELQNFGKPNSYLKKFKESSQVKRDFMVKALTDSGLEPIIPEGGYFIVANLTTLEFKNEISGDTHMQKNFNSIAWMIKNLNLSGTPIVTGYSEKNQYFGAGGVRLTMIKKDSTLQEVAKRFSNWKLKGN